MQAQYRLSFFLKKQYFIIYYFSYASMKIEIKYQFIEVRIIYIILCHHFKILLDLTGIKYLNTIIYKYNKIERKLPEERDMLIKNIMVL